MLAEDVPLTARHLDILTLLDQLQHLVETAPGLPLSDRIVVSSDVVLDLLDAVRNTLPHDLVEAERVLQERHRMLEDARDEAESLLANSREQSKFMLQEHHLVKAAELKAERIINQAQREADEIMESADEYIQKLFSKFADEAARLAADIRRAAAQRA